MSAASLVWAELSVGVLQLIGALLFALGSVLIVVSGYQVAEKSKNDYNQGGNWVWLVGSILFGVSAEL
jgi:hypothetical protein